MWSLIMGSIILLVFFLLLQKKIFAEKSIFTYQHIDNLEATSVNLCASFNNWHEIPMKKGDNGIWKIELELDPGEYQYKYRINGIMIKDMAVGRSGSPVNPEASAYVFDGTGGQNAVLRVRDKCTKKMKLYHLSHDPAYLCICDERLVIRVKASLKAIKKIFLLTNEEGKWPMEKQLEWNEGEMYRISLKVPEFLHYRFTGYTKDGKEFHLPEKISHTYFFDGVNRFKRIEWLNGGIIYQIFPERFYNGNPQNDLHALRTDEFNYNKLWDANKLWDKKGPTLSQWNEPITPQHCCHQYFGGDISGITSKLDYLRDLGVNILYLNPIFDSGSSHGYDTHDYMKISPKFGDDKDLNIFLDEAHRRSIKIILDFVPNHTGLGFWAFQDVIEKGKDSKYWNWYFIYRWPFSPGDATAYETWWGFGSLPKLNTKNPEVREYLFEVTRHWLNLGIDGWRVDVPEELENAEEFFKAMHRVAKREKENTYLVAEVWKLDSTWVQGDQFDSLMNYALGRDILLNYARGSINGKNVLDNLSRYYAVYGENVVSMGFNIIGSHDTQRILTDLGGGNFGDVPTTESIRKLKFLTTLLYTLPGAPVIFQGDERGLLGDKEFYDAQRYAIQWQSVNKGVLLHYKKCAGWYRKIPALTSGVFRVNYGKNGLLSFFRGEKGIKEAVIAANNGKKSIQFKLPPGEWWPVTQEQIVKEKVSIPSFQLRIFIHSLQFLDNL